jgi:hypothetical protein
MQIPMTALAKLNPQAVAEATYGTAFALEHHARCGLGARAGRKLNREVAHEAMTIARAAVDGMDALEEMARGMVEGIESEVTGG